jgi:hypothetical protein
VRVGEHLDLDVARLSMNFSMNTRSSPKASAPRWWRAEALAALGLVPATRMPLPPPPAEALSITG